MAEWCFCYLSAMTTPKTIFFSDIDGTLLNAEREVSSVLQQEVKMLTEKGHPFILISSRMPAAMTHLQEDLGITGLPLIAYNGGLVLANGEVLHSREIPLRTMNEVRALTTPTNLSLQLFHGDEWYVETMDFYAMREQRNTKVIPQIRSATATLRDWTKRNIGPHKIMVMGEPEELDSLVSALTEAYAGELHLYRSKDTYLEIADKRISKLTGIRTLLDRTYPATSLEHCIAFGDNYNDIEMLAGVGVGVAVGNARPEVVAVADAVTAGNKEDGVAKWLAERLS